MKEILPDRVTKTSAIQSIETRADFNRLVSSLERFTKRGMEKPVTLDNGVTVTKWEEKALKESIKDFNNKLDYHKRMYKGNAPYLPDNKSYDKVIATIENVDEVRRVTQSLQDFLKPGATNLVKSERSAIFTEWELKERLAQQERDNEIKRKEREEVLKEPVKIGGKEQNATRAQMGSIKENTLKESIKDPLKMSQKEWDKFRERLDKRLDTHERQEKKEQMRENYIKGLRDSEFLNKNPEIENYIRGVDIDTFIKTVETDETATFLFYKDPQAFEARLEFIESAWLTAYEEFNSKE